MKKAGFFLIAAGILMAAPQAVKNITDGRDSTVGIIYRQNSRPEGKGPLVIEELFLSGWIARGYAGPWQPGLEMPFNDFNPRTDAVFIFNDRELYEQAGRVFGMKIPGAAEYAQESGLFYIKIKGMLPEHLKNMGMGFIESGGKLFLKDKPVYIRPVNDRWVNGRYIRYIFNRYEFDGVIFKGNEIIGYPGHVGTLKEIMEKKDPLLFSIEFSPQKGFSNLAKGRRVARLHSLPEELPAEKLISRVLRGVRERNIRAVYLKSPEQIELSGELKTELEKNNFTVGVPPGLRIEYTGRPAFLSGAAVLLLGLVMVLGVRGKILAASAAVLAAAAFMGSPYLRWVLCAGVGVLFPVFAVSYASGGKSSFWDSLGLLIISSAAAGLIINSLYSLPAYAVKIQQIRGIKFMLIAPPAAAALVLFKGADMRHYIKGALSRREFIYILLALALGFLYLLRSSNNFPSLVGTFEIRLRSLMENIFLWRPRFKEFLMGHPALITGLYLFKRSNIKKTLPKILIIEGIVGQASVINSFMHIHTPVSGTLLRTLWGYILGAAASLVIIFIIKRWQKRKI